MYCTNCGEEIPDTATFCSECGSEQKVRTTERKDVDQTDEKDQSVFFKFPGISRKNTSRRNLITGIGYSLGGLMIIGTIGEGGSNEDDDSSSTSSEEQYPNAWDYDESTGIVLEDIHANTGQFSTTIVGEATNESGDDYSYVQISFSLYDSTNTKVGDALANTNGLAAGQTWQFEAMGAESGTVESFDIEDITVY